MTSITVCGTAQIAVAPDRACAHLSIAHVARTSSLALDVIHGRSRQLAGLLIELGYARVDWVAQGAAVSEEWEWKRETHTKVGYRATSGVIVRINDVARIDQLLNRAVEEIPAVVQGLRWSVSESNPARRAVLAAAATDAMYRADAYADALGPQRGAVQVVSDIPFTTTSEPQQLELPPAEVAAADRSGTPSIINPGEIELSARVYVRFAAAPFTDLPRMDR